MYTTMEITNPSFYKSGGLSREPGESVKERIGEKRYLKGGECSSLLFYYCYCPEAIWEGKGLFPSSEDVKAETQGRH